MLRCTLGNVQPPQNQHKAIPEAGIAIVSRLCRITAKACSPNRNFATDDLTLLRCAPILMSVETTWTAFGTMTPKQFQQIAKALADPQRFAILERIAAESGELACRTLVQECTVSQATISHHLKELNEAGLIATRREAQCAFMRLNRETIQTYWQELSRRMALGS